MKSKWSREKMFSENYFIWIFKKSTLFSLYIFFFLHFSDSALQRCLWWTWWHPQYRLRVEILQLLLRVLEEPLLQVADPVFRLLYRRRVGLRVCLHRFLPCMVHNPMFQVARDQLRSLPAIIRHVHQLLHDAMLRIMRRNFPSLQKVKFERKNMTSLRLFFLMWIFVFTLQLW